MSDILTMKCEEGREEGEACFLLSSGAVLPQSGGNFASMAVVAVEMI